MNQQPKSWNLVFLLLVMVLALVLFSGVLSENEAPKELSYSDVVTLFREEKVDSFVLKGSSLTMQLKKEQDGSKTASAELGDTDLFHSDLDALIASQYKAGVLRSYDYQPAPSAPWYKTILPYLLIGAALLLLWYYLMG